MPNEMAERVARALREELRKIGYGVGTINADQLADALVPAAIEAMREPTAHMLDVMSPVDDGDPLDLARANLQAGIDAALK